MEGSTFGGTDIYVDPAAFCGVAARMLAAEGRAGIPAVLALLGQALRAEVDLLEAGTTRSAIPRPRLRRVSPQWQVPQVAPIDLPVRSRDVVLAVLSIEPSLGLPATWTVVPGPLATLADLLALTLSAGPGPDSISDVRSTSQHWFEADELDRVELAGHLHDGLVQSLVAARYLLDLAASTWPDGPQPWLEAVRESLQAALSDGRTLLSAVQPRTRDGRGLRAALSELCTKSPVPVELLTAGGADLDLDPPLSPVAAAAGFRFVQAALVDLIARGSDAAEVRLAYGPSGLSIDVQAIGERPAWPDEPHATMRRWAARIDLLGGSTLLQPASAHLRFGAADGEPASLPCETRVERTM